MWEGLAGVTTLSLGSSPAQPEDIFPESKNGTTVCCCPVASKTVDHVHLDINYSHSQESSYSAGKALF